MASRLPRSDSAGACAFSGHTFVAKGGRVCSLRRAALQAGYFRRWRDGRPLRWSSEWRSIFRAPRPMWNAMCRCCDALFCKRNVHPTQEQTQHSYNLHFSWTFIIFYIDRFILLACMMYENLSAESYGTAAVTNLATILTVALSLLYNRNKMLQESAKIYVITDNSNFSTI